MILVNLTCGRNPWKKATPEDSTFRAFLKDSTFLSSILPISPELNAILQRVFECDPRHRIGLDELRALILACPRFTAPCYASLPPSSPQSPVEYVDTMDCTGDAQGQGAIFVSHRSDWSLFEPTSKQNSSYSATSSDSGYDSDCSYTSNHQPFNFYGNVIPFSDPGKVSYYAPPSFISTPITAF